MGDGFIVRRGGAAKTAAPTLTLVEKGQDYITFSVTNNDTESVELAYTEQNPSTQVFESLVNGESAEVTIDGLDAETQYTIYATATSLKKVQSDMVELVVTTDYLPGIWYGSRGVFGGGLDQMFDTLNTIEYITIATPGNAINFGNLTVGRRNFAATSDGSRGVFGGGSGGTNILDYITIATPGNAIDFGDLTVARSYLAATSDGVRGVFGGGIGESYSNVIDYITIATTGNAIDFGDLSVARLGLAATSDGSRGVFGGGVEDDGITNTIDYITIATPGNAIDFGDLTVSTWRIAATSNGSRGVFAGGRGINPDYGYEDSLNIIEYITIATPGNAIDFGDLTVAREGLAGTSDGSRGVFGGGDDTGFSGFTVIDYITIATPGNAIDFGDLSVQRYEVAATSGS